MPLRTKYQAVVIGAITAIVSLGFIETASAGVLIGQLPQNGGVEVTDLKWAIQKNEIRLVLVTSAEGGKIVEHPLNSYPVSMVRHALRYAVDGRPLTVTMITAEPLSDLKILLHPAILDTSLGRQAIKLDQLVDENANGELLQERLAQDARVRSHHALYELAWAARAKPLLEWYISSIERNNDNEQRKGIENNIRPVLMIANRYLADKERRLLAEDAISKLNKEKSRKSILQIKNEYYDPAIVSQLLDSDSQANLDGTLKLIGGMGEGIIRELQNRNRINQYIDGMELAEIRKETEKIFKNTLATPPRFTIWSGVRERSYRGEITDYLAPESPEKIFRFMVQVAFTSAPEFLKEKEVTEYSDTSPYEYNEIEQKINDRVMLGLKFDPEGMASLKAMSSFTQLQRIFRAAIAGKLGDKFPMERLLDLASDLGKDQPSKDFIKTMRWLPRTGSTEIFGIAQILAACGANEQDMALLSGAQSDFRLQRVLLRSIAMTELDKFEKNADPLTKRAGGAYRKCLSLLLERLEYEEAFQKKIAMLTSADEILFATNILMSGFPAIPSGLTSAARESAWDGHEAAAEKWLVRWKQAAISLDGDGINQEPIKKAAHTISLVDYVIQARHRMRVIDSERIMSEQRRWGR